MSDSYDNQSPRQVPDLPAYQYSPLPQNHIRLIQLTPNRDHNAPIRCQLIDYPIISRKRGSHIYNALSYVWGPPPNTVRIEVIDQLDSSASAFLSIRENCHVALLRLRDPVLPRFIWVDSICINQEDNAEKAVQILLMAQIYALADCVVVWLREPRPVDTAKGAGETETDGTAHGELGYPSRALEIIGMVAEYRALNPGASYSLEPDNEQDACNLLERSWFRRIWVLQEAAAARRIVVMDGHDEMDGDSFCLGVEALNSEESIAISLRTASRRVQPATLLMKSAGLRSRMSPSIQTLLGTRSIAELVNTFHGHEATDRRDKVFALLGLGANIPMELSANYDISWGEVFRRLIRSCIGNSEAYIETWDDQEIAIMKPEVMVLGHFVAERGFARGSVEEANMLHVQFSGEKLKGVAIPWNRKRTALPPREGDILCLLPGATRPTIIRPLQLHTHVYCAIISIVESPNGRLSNDEDYDEEWYVGFASEQGLVDSRVTNRLRHIKESPLFLTECWVVWDWGVLEAGTVEDSASGRDSLLAGFRSLEPESTGITAERATAHIELMARSEIRRLPETFQDMVSTHENFGRLLALAGHQTEPRYILRPVMKYYDDVFGPTSPRTVTAIRRISEIYRESGDSVSEDETAWSAQVIGRSGRCLRITEATLLYCFERPADIFDHRCAERRMNTLCKFREKEVGQSVTQVVLEAACAYSTDMMEALLRCVMKADATVHGINTAKLVELAVTAKSRPRFDFQQILSFMLMCEHISDRHDEGVLVSLKAFEDLVGRERLYVETVGDPWDEPFEKANWQGVVGFILDRLGDRIAKDVKQLILVEAAGTQTGWPAAYDASLQMSLLLDQWGDDIFITEEVMELAARRDCSTRQMTKLLVGRYEGRVPVTERVLCAAVENIYDGGQALEALTHHQGVTPEITEWVLETAAKDERGYGWTRSIRDPLFLLLDKCRGDPPVTKRVLIAVLKNWSINRTEVFGTLLDVLDEKLASHGERTAYRLFNAAAESRRHGFEYIRMLVEGYGDQGPLSESDASELLQYASHWQETGAYDEKPAFLLDAPASYDMYG